MKPVEQTIFELPLANCVQACVAAVLELELDRVPNFMERPGKGWAKAFVAFLAKFDLSPLELDIKQSKDAGFQPTGYHLINGKGPRGVEHAVVGLNGEMVHDPHPSKSGLVTEESWTVFVACLMDKRGG